MTQRIDTGLVEQLTPREREVLELLRQGLPDAEIARRLDITPAGAGYHVSQIIGKLGVRNRYEAAAWPDRPPWWMRAIAPLAALFGRAGRGANAVALGAALALFIAALAGIGTLAFLLAQGDGGGSDAPAPGTTVQIPQDAVALTNYAFTTQLDTSGRIGGDTDETGELSVTFEGTYQMPDRMRGTIEIQGIYEEGFTDVLGQPAAGEVAVIGDTVWWRDEDGAWHLGENISYEMVNPLVTFRQYATPDFYLEALQFDTLEMTVDGAAKEINGVEAFPVQLDKQEIVDLLPQGTGISRYPDPEEYNDVFPSIGENAQQVLPESFLVEVWFATGELYPVRILFDFEVTEDDFSNLSFVFQRPAEVRLQLDIMDPDIDRPVEAPLPPPTATATNVPPPPGATIPSLTEEDQERIMEIALNDPQLEDVIGARAHSVEGFGVWHDAQLQKLGGAFVMEFDEPFSYETDWPSMLWDEATDEPSVVLVHFRAEQITRLRVMVHLPSERVVEIDPEGAEIADYTPTPAGTVPLRD